VNGGSGSVQDRYAYYRHRPHLVSALLETCVKFVTDALLSRTVLPLIPHFRRDVALATYGDDKLRTRAPGVVLHPSSRDIFRDELGLVVTNAAKDSGSSSLPFS